GEFATGFTQDGADFSTIIDGDYLYLGRKYDGDGFLTVLDISTPATPTEVTNYMVTTTNVGLSKLMQKDHYLFGQSEPGTRTIDISTPSSPNLVGGLASESGNFTISGDYLFAELSFSELQIAVYDISSPASEILLYTIDKNSGAIAEAMLVYNGYLYSAEDDGNLYIYQVAEPYVNALDQDGSPSTFPLYDDLGDHTAAENLQLSDHWLSNDGDGEGISISDDGNTTLSGSLTIGGNYTLPNADGTADQYLATDGTGTLSWIENIDDQVIDTFYLADDSLRISLENDALDALAVDLGSITPITLADADGNTQIQVEESSNDDIIRFDLGGIEFMRLDSGRIETYNMGNSVFIGEDAGQNDDYDNNVNVFVGYKAGQANTSGDRNVFLGAEAGDQTTSGKENIFIGFKAGYDNTTGSGNIFVGQKAGFNETGSNKLYLDNSDTASPLIWGDFNNDRLVINGNSGNNSNNRTLFVNGSIGATSAFNNDSDRRLKSNIQTIPNALDKVVKMRGVTYQWKDGREAGDRMGFIAQEVEPILPEVVDHEKDHYTMQYAPVTALLVEAIKAQQKQIENLQVENGILKTQVNKVHQLEQQNEEMKAMLEQIQQRLDHH
ncbi:MAG: tail fiber domain-containing protein, partial [Bacteroidota bacterium]